jgi:hypothetical protein
MIVILKRVQDDNESLFKNNLSDILNSKRYLIDYRTLKCAILRLRSAQIAQKPNSSISAGYIIFSKFFDGQAYNYLPLHRYLVKIIFLCLV